MERVFQILSLFRVDRVKYRSWELWKKALQCRTSRFGQSYMQNQVSNQNLLAPTTASRNRIMLSCADFVASFAPAIFRLRGLGKGTAVCPDVRVPLAQATVLKEWTPTTQH